MSRHKERAGRIRPSQVNSGEIHRTFYSKSLLINQDAQGAIYTDAQPQVTAFAKELLIPGSTRKN